MGHMKFRYDINGLRALAVTAVVLFHYKLDFVPGVAKFASGGFVGVDVFFVISGYLMTTIIMGRLAEDRFSIWKFYHDRAKRIVPGLLGLCFFLLAVGYFTLDPISYRDLGSTTISALMFFSNFRLAEAAGYFDQISNTNWLLHSWSLSVEWQFYIIYPIILVVLHKHDGTRRLIVPILWSLAIVSLILCIWTTKIYPLSAFYLLPQRAWEMLAGALVALQLGTRKQKHPRLLLAIGLLLIGISIAFYDKSLPWPYYWALLPVIGTCIVIAAHSADSYVFKNAIVQTIGRWSYAIYLWHWPIAVAAIYFGFTASTLQKFVSEILILAAVIASGGILLALTERVSSAALAQVRWLGLVSGAGALAMTVCFAIAVIAYDGLEDRGPNGLKVMEAFKATKIDWVYPSSCSGRDPLRNVRPCQLGKPEASGVLFIGDSFLMQTYSRYMETAQRNPSASYTFLTNAGCPPIIGIRFNFDQYDCNGFVEKALDFAATHDFTRIVLFSSWYNYFNPYDNNLCFLEGDACTWSPDASWYREHLEGALAKLRSRLVEFQKRGTEIVIVSSTPVGRWDVPKELVKRYFLGMDTKEIEYVDRDEFERWSSPLKGLLISMASSIGAKFIDPLDFLCTDHRCPTMDETGMSYYFDLGHLRSSTVRGKRFQFLDQLAGAPDQYSSTPVGGLAE
jgi:peptidoglycan/LPS O-acetylase OafA/YrhL